MALAAVLYATARPDGTAYLLPIQLAQILPAVESGAALGSLPTFLHVFSFALLTVAVGRPQSASACIVISCGWCLVNVMFEAGQHPNLAPAIEGILPSSFGFLPLLENVGPFFINGTFDSLDLFAAAFGALAAVGFIMWARSKESEL